MPGLQQYFVVFLAFCVSLSLEASITSQNVGIKDMSNTAAPTGSDCEHRTPCAWGVYVPFSRKIDYYMKNTCKCAKDTECIKVDDDISVSAYIYRCVKHDPTITYMDDPFSEFPTKLPDSIASSS